MALERPEFSLNGPDNLICIQGFGVYVYRDMVQETAANLKIVMNHVVTYFGPNGCLSKQKLYLRYNMIKPRRLTTRQYVGLVRDLNSRMDQLPPLF